MRGSRTLRAVGTDTASKRYRVPAERAARRRAERRDALRRRSSWYRPPDQKTHALQCQDSPVFDMPVPLPECTHVAATPLGFCTRCLGPLRSACTVQVQTLQVVHRGAYRARRPWAPCTRQPSLPQQSDNKSFVRSAGRLERA